LIGFAKIAGGTPGSAVAMTDHLLAMTLAPEQVKLATYYGRGGVSQDSELAELARQVAEQKILFTEALDALMSSYICGGGDLDLLDAAQERIEKRLSDLAFRIQEGLEDAPLAIIRPDMHPLVAVGLGIDPAGMLSKAEINALLSGNRADGERIDGKHYAVERQLPIDPKDREVRYSTPIGSYDFTTSADKSVSVAHAFATPVEQAMIYNAHVEASREAVAYIASDVGRARLGDGGKDGFEAGHVGWLEFTHLTSRRVMVVSGAGKDKDIRDQGPPGDPELHTHHLIPNAVWTETGRVGSLDTAAIGGFLKEAGAYYQACLAQRLRDAGFEVVLDRTTGSARMPIVPEEVRTLFSKRTNTGEANAREGAASEGLAWDALSPAEQVTRSKNATQSRDQRRGGGKDEIANVEDWKRQAKEIGWEPQSLQLYGPPVPGLTLEDRHRKAYEIALPFLAEKLEREAVVPHFDLRIAALRGLIETGIADLSDVSTVTRLMWKEGVQQFGSKTPLAYGQEEGVRHVSVTTVLHGNEEAEFVRLGKTAAADRSGAIPEQLLYQKVRESSLDFTDAHGKAQLAATERLAQGGRFGLVIGSAGAGKSTLLQPLVAAWKEQQRDVWGASLAWRQADALEAAGISRNNVKAFSVLVDSLKDGSIKLTARSVVAVDEWGLLGTRQGLELLRFREAMGFSVVALGDEKQCGSIEAGAIIDLSRRALGVEQVPVISTTKRQQSEREREIVGLLRQGRAAEALEMKRADNTAEMAPDRQAVITRVAKLYVERLTETGEAPGINVPTNRDAHEIGQAVREERRKLGLVGSDLVIVKATLKEAHSRRNYNLPLSKGDNVRLHRSTGATYSPGKGGAIGRNGSVLEVMDANDAGLLLKARTGKVGLVKWQDLKDKGDDRIALSYGDAVTIHTAQGSGRGEQITAFPEGSQAVDGLMSYSALTRHFRSSYLVTNERAEQSSVRKRRPINDAREITIDDKWANVARSLAYQPIKDSALSLMDRAGQLRQGGIGLFQKSVLPAEPAHRAGDALSRGPEIAQNQKLDRSEFVRQLVDLARDLPQRTAHIAREVARHVREGWDLSR
jgi:conjugative relaxase-like TrwC/TraI family protein